MTQRAARRLNYLRRVVPAYVLGRESQLSFWHERPEINHDADIDELGPYYMLFTTKADYSSYLDPQGVPLLNYRGTIGIQYNPIAVAQYGLGNYNLWVANKREERRDRALRAARWLVDNLETNGNGFKVWNHHFDWEYRTPLRAPWYSALAQGQGVSLLVRANRVSGEQDYLAAAALAFESLMADKEEGGVAHRDERGHLWLEEYLVEPPTHILNGFVWALWGVYDYYLATAEPKAKSLFEECVATLTDRLIDYDTGYWSLYEQSGTRLKMVASPFYHHLHIVQLMILARLTGEGAFVSVARRWDRYRASRVKRYRALGEKALFKLCYY